MEPTPTKSLLLPVLLSILGSAVVFGGTGYYLGTATVVPTSTDTATQTTQATPTTKITVTTKATATPDETANWKTYTNTKYGYSVKYPDTGWFIYDEKGRRDSDFMQTTGTVNFALEGGGDRVHYIEASSEALQTKIDYWTNNLKSKLNYSKTTTTVAGKSATQFTYTEQLKQTNDSDDKVLVFSDGKYTFVLAGTIKDYEKTGGKDAGNFDTILSTFTLTK
jgi:hypothetical protein